MINIQILPGSKCIHLSSDNTEHIAILREFVRECSLVLISDESDWFLTIKGDSGTDEKDIIWDLVSIFGGVWYSGVGFGRLDMVDDDQFS